MPGRDGLRYDFVRACSRRSKTTRHRSERGHRTVHLGSMPSSVYRRCSVLYVFSLYLLLSLFLPTSWAFHAVSILARLVLGPDTCWWTVLRDSHAPLRDDRKNEYAPARFILVVEERKNEG